MYELSEGRTTLTRNHRNQGVKVHVADADGAFIRIYVSPSTSLDANADDAVLVDRVQETPITFHVTVGASATQLVVRYECLDRPQVLLDDLFVHPHEEVWISSSHPNRHTVYGRTIFQ